MRFKTIKIIVFFVLTSSFVFSAQGQDVVNQKTYKIIRSNLGAGGSSKSIVTSKGQYKISQSIGQTSVIGTYAGRGYYLRQGYQQPSGRVKVSKTSTENSLMAKVHPNPFGSEVSVSFTETTTEPISVSVYDISGKLIYSKEFSPSKFIRIDLRHVSTGSYLLKAFSNGKAFNAKLIKL